MTIIKEAIMSLMYCPKCESQTEINVTGASNHPKKEKRLYYKRTRTCQKCSTQYYTVEVEERFIKEFDEIKNAIMEIYKYAKQFIHFRDRIGK